MNDSVINIYEYQGLMKNKEINTESDTEQEYVAKD